MSNDDIVNAISDRMLEPPDEPEPVRYCDYCGEPMFVGDQKWEIDGDVICEDCAKNTYMEILRE